MGILRSVAASTGGTVGYPPKPTTADGVDAPEQTQGLQRSEPEQRRGARQRHGVAAAHGRAGDDVNAPCRERHAVALGAFIGGEIDDDAAAAERDGERFGGKQMAAGPAGGEQHDGRIVSCVCRHGLGRTLPDRCAVDLPCRAGQDQAGRPTGTNSFWLASNSARGRSRVKASSMPMP